MFRLQVRIFSRLQDDLVCSDHLSVHQKSVAGTYYPAPDMRADRPLTLVLFRKSSSVESVARNLVNSAVLSDFPEHKQIYVS